MKPLLSYRFSLHFGFGIGVKYTETMLNSDVKIKSEVLINQLESYTLSLREIIKNESNIDFLLKDVIVAIRKLDLAHNNKFQLLDSIVLPK